MGKQVPLVIYERGIRKVLGMASVENDGSITAQVAKDLWPTVRGYFLPDVGELSINPAPKPVLINYNDPM